MGSAAIVAAAAAAVAVAEDNDRRSVLSARENAESDERIRAAYRGLRLVANGKCSWEDFEVLFDHPYKNPLSHERGKDIPEYLCAARALNRRAGRAGGVAAIQSDEARLKKLFFAIRVMPLSEEVISIFKSHPNGFLKHWLLSSQSAFAVLSNERIADLGKEWFGEAWDSQEQCSFDEFSKRGIPWYSFQDHHLGYGRVDKEEMVRVINTKVALYNRSGKLRRWFLRCGMNSFLKELTDKISAGSRWAELLPLSCLDASYVYILPYWLHVNFPPIWYNLIKLVEREQLSPREIDALLRYPHYAVRKAVEKKYSYQIIFEDLKTLDRG